MNCFPDVLTDCFFPTQIRDILLRENTKRVYIDKEGCR